MDAYLIDLSVADELTEKSKSKEHTSFGKAFPWMAAGGR